MAAAAPSLTDIPLPGSDPRAGKQSAGSLTDIPLPGAAPVASSPTVAPAAPYIRPQGAPPVLPPVTTQNTPPAVTPGPASAPPSGTLTGPQGAPQVAPQQPAPPPAVPPQGPAFDWETKAQRGQPQTVPNLPKVAPGPQDVNRMAAATLLSDVSPLIPLSRTPPPIKAPAYKATPEEENLHAADRGLDTLPAWMHGPHARIAAAGPASRQIEGLRTNQAQATVAVGKRLPQLMQSWLAEDKSLTRQWASLAQFAKANQDELDPASVRAFQQAQAKLKAATAAHAARGEQLDALRGRVRQTWQQYSDKPLFSRNYPEEEAFRSHSVGGDAWGWVVDQVTGLASPLSGALKGNEDRLLNQKMLTGEYPPNPVIPAKNQQDRARYINRWNDVQKFVEDRKLYDAGQANYPRSDLEARYNAFSPWQKQWVGIAQKQLDARMDARFKSGRGIGALGDAALWAATELGGRAAGAAVGRVMEKSVAPWLLRLAEGNITPGLIRAIAARSPQLAQAMAHGGTLMGLQGGASTLAATHDPLAALKATGSGALEGMLFGGLATGGEMLTAPVAGAIRSPLVRDIVHKGLGVGAVSAAGGTLAAGKALVQGKGVRGAAAAAGPGAASAAVQGGLFTLLHSLQAGPEALAHEPVYVPDRAQALADWAHTTAQSKGWTENQARSVQRVVYRLATAAPEARVNLWQQQPAATQRLLTSLGSLYGPPAPEAAPPPSHPTATPTVPNEPRITNADGVSLSLRHLRSDVIEGIAQDAERRGDLHTVAVARGWLALHEQHVEHQKPEIPPEQWQQYTNDKAKPGNKHLAVAAHFKRVAKTVETDNPDLAQKLKEGADAAERDHQREWHQKNVPLAATLENGAPEAVGHPLASAWDRMSPEERTSLPAGTRRELAVQSISNSLQVEDPSHPGIHRMSEVPGKPKTQAELEVIADQEFKRAQETMAARHPAPEVAPPLEQPAAAPTEVVGPAEAPAAPSAQSGGEASVETAPAAPEAAPKAVVTEFGKTWGGELKKAEPEAETERAPHETPKAEFVAKHGAGRTAEELGVAKSPVAEKGEPGYRIEATQYPGETPQHQVVVYRDAEGVAHGTLEFSGGPEALRGRHKTVAVNNLWVDPEARGNGIGEGLYAALAAGGHEEQSLGSRFMTEDGAALYHKRAVRTALERGETVPDNVLADYPKLQAQMAEGRHVGGTIDAATGLGNEHAWASTARGKAVAVARISHPEAPVDAAMMASVGDALRKAGLGDTAFHLGAGKITVTGDDPKQLADVLGRVKQILAENRGVGPEGAHPEGIKLDYGIGTTEGAAERAVGVEPAHGGAAEEAAGQTLPTGRGKPVREGGAGEQPAPRRRARPARGAGGGGGVGKPEPAASGRPGAGDQEAAAGAARTAKTEGGVERATHSYQEWQDRIDALEERLAKEHGEDAVHEAGMGRASAVLEAERRRLDALYEARNQQGEREDKAALTSALSRLRPEAASGFFTPEQVRGALADLQKKHALAAALGTAGTQDRAALEGALYDWLSNEAHYKGRQTVPLDWVGNYPLARELAQGRRWAERGFGQSPQPLLDQVKSIADDLLGTAPPPREKPAAARVSGPKALPAAGKKGAARTDGVVEGEIVAPETSAAKPLWEMSPDDLDTAYEQAKQDEKQLLTDLFGKEGAQEYRALQSRANSSHATGPQIDAAAAQIERMEALLTPAERQRLDSGTDPAEIREYQRALGQLDATSAAELGESLKYALTQVGQETDPARMTGREQVAYAMLREGMRLAVEHGLDTTAITKQAVKGAAERFGDAEDAGFMLRRFAKEFAKETAPPDSAKKSTPELPPGFRSGQIGLLRRNRPPTAPPPGFENPAYEQWREDNTAPTPPVGTEPWYVRLGHQLTRRTEHLPTDAYHAPLDDRLKRLQSLPQLARQKATTLIAEPVKDLSPEERSLFTAWLLHANWTENATKGIPNPPEIEAQGHEGLVAEGTSLLDRIAASPKVQAAVVTWRRNLDGASTAYAKSKTDIGQAAPGFTKEDWFHQEFLAPTMETARLAAEGAKAAGGRRQVKAVLHPDFTMRREGGVNYHADPVQAHFNAVADMIAATERNKIVALLQKPEHEGGYNAMPVFKAKQALGKDKEARQWFSDLEGRGGAIVVREIPESVGQMAVAGMLPDEAGGKWQHVIDAIAQNHALNTSGAVAYTAAGRAPFEIDPSLTTDLRDYARRVREFYEAPVGGGKAESARYPEGYTPYKFVDGNTLYKAHSIPERLAQELIDGVVAELQVKRSDLRDILAIGRSPDALLLRDTVARTIGDLQPEKPGLLDQLFRRAVRGSKMFGVLNPEHTPALIKEHLIGSLITTARANPKILTHLPAAINDLMAARLRNEIPSPEYQGFLFEGGGRDFHTNIGNVGEDAGLNYLAKLAEDQRSNPKKVWDAAQRLVMAGRVPVGRLDEAFRYAIYRSVGAEIDGTGGIEHYLSARPDLANAIGQVNGRNALAYYMSDQLMGAYGDMPQFFRQLANVFPSSYSGFLFGKAKSETGLMANNLWRQPAIRRALMKRLTGEGAGASERVASGLTVTEGALRFLGPLLLLSGAVTANNVLRFKRQEDEMGPQAPHLDLGRFADGRMMVWDRVGALPGLVSLVGMDDAWGFARQIANGNMTFKEAWRQISSGGRNDLLSMAAQAKIPIELATGHRLSTGGKILDKYEYVADALHVGEFYRTAERLAGKSTPTAPGRERLVAALLGAHLVDPAEEAFRQSVGNAREWIQAQRALPQDVKSDSAWTPLQAAIYGYRRALQLGDHSSAMKYVAAIAQARQAQVLAQPKLRAQGTKALEEPVRKALARMEPLYGIPPAQTARYLKSLTPRERVQLRSGYIYWRTLAAPGAPVPKTADLGAFIGEIRGPVLQSIKQEVPISKWLQQHPFARSQAEKQVGLQQRQKAAWKSGKAPVSVK